MGEGRSQSRPPAKASISSSASDISLCLISGMEGPSVTPIIVSKSLLQSWPHLQTEYMILPSKNRPPDFEVLEIFSWNCLHFCSSLPQDTVKLQTPWINPARPPAKAEAASHLICCPRRSRLHHPSILPLRASCRSTHCSPGPTCSPRSAWYSQPGRSPLLPQDLCS